VCVSFDFVAEGQITQPLIVIIDQIVAEGNVSLLFNGKLDNGYCDVLLPAQDRERLDTFGKQLLTFGHESSCFYPTFLTFLKK
jgi:hypothetical protein